MNDPWDVKSVRQSGQYLSCMKINGVPLLPPVLSKECHKEMQYYKLLAKEVEKRISYLKPYTIDTDSDDDNTDATDLLTPESEHSYEEQIQAGFDVSIDKITGITNEKLPQKSDSPQPHSLAAEYCNNITITDSVETPTLVNSPRKLVIDLSLSINETGKKILETVNNKSTTVPQPIELPERDYDCIKNSKTKEILTELDSKFDNPQNETSDVVNFSFSLDNEILSDPFPDLSINRDGPSSLSSKSFTGSLINIHTESKKESQIPHKLIRQRSYTLLQPSPQLLAHLEVQSINTGVEINSISMSESLSNLSSPYKKRRSWDLESAKVKWSSMALELNQKNLATAAKVNGVIKSNVSKSASKKLQSTSPPRSRSIAQDKSRRSTASKASIKSEPVQRPAKKSLSPVRNVPSNRTITKTPSTPKTSTPKKDVPQTSLTSDSDDPATRVRELYEKIQKQQLVQMAHLVEKQKREQLLLQQVFEEQNNLLYKQLKTICPKSPIEAKEAWADKNVDNTNIGPVSLSQLINHKSHEPTNYESPLSNTLTETNSYLNHSSDILKKSKDITSSIKRPSNLLQGHTNVTNNISPKLKLEGSRTRTHSPTRRNTSRKLNYDTSASSDREYEPVLTDRTNDTMADLNVTFPTDQSDECQSFNINDTVLNHLCSQDMTVVHRSPAPSSRVGPPTTNKSAESNARNAIKQECNQTNATFICNPTPQQRAASRIVAGARGFLVRRLLRTQRVQATVQTIRDALLCALQLHQDRQGIRGADVDLHRRLIQQITAACYALHDAFINSTPRERCAMIAADRARRRSLAARQSPRSHQDIMTQSHSGSFPTRAKRPASASLMTQSNYETFSEAKPCYSSSRRYVPSPHRRPWR